MAAVKTDSSEHTGDMSFKFSPIQNQRGESLISVAVAIAILGAVALLTVPMISGSKMQMNNMQQSSFCQDLSRNILAQIRSNGLQTKVYRAPSSANSVSFNDRQWRNSTSSYTNLNRGGVASEHGVGTALDSIRWPNQRVMQWDTSNNRFVSNAPRLLFSSMNVLQAINNGFSNRACTLPLGIAIDATSGLESLLTPATLAQYAEAGYFVQASIKTQPFSVVDETDLPCDPNLQLRPFGIQEPPMTDTFGITNGFGTRYDPNRGIRAEVFVTVDHIDPGSRGGKFLKSCSTSEKFQFDRVQSQIAYPQFDTSGPLRITLDSPPATAPQPRRPLTGLFLACTYEYQVVNLRPFAGGIVHGNLNQWIPCEQVSICGSGPPTISENEFQIAYQFDRLPPSNCAFAMRVMAFDAVGNSLSYPSFMRCWGGSPSGCCEEEAGTSNGCGGSMGRPAN